VNLRPRVKQIQPLAGKDTSRRFLFRCYEFLVKAALSPPSRTVCGLISPSSYPCTLNAARFERDITFGTHLWYGPELPPDSRQIQHLIAALGIAMPWRPTGRPLRRGRTISAFCFPLIRSFTMKCTMQRVHGFCASYWLSQRTASLIKSAWVVGRQLGITFACSLAFSIREHLLQPNCIAKRRAPRCACSVRIRHFAATWAGPCVRVSGYFATDAP
jgi:hypothetical protein